jgi:formamidopyrimidine-DNA glycosylase
MPELPEVETVRRGLEPAMTGRTITKISLHREGLRVPFPANLAKIVAGRPVNKLTRRAKYLLVHIGGGVEDILIIHLGMSGQLTIAPDIASYKTRKHDHMIITLDSGAGVVFNDARRFGMVMLSPAISIEGHVAFHGMGPEPLPEDFTGKILQDRLSRKSTPIKVALLDQRVVAGVGNIYASEALFEAGVSPLRKSSTLKPAEADRLAQAIRSVMMRAIASGGSSLRAFRQAGGELGYFQHSFAVYDHEASPCPRCKEGAKKKAIIKKIVQAGRATYYCPACQK